MHLLYILCTILFSFISIEAQQGVLLTDGFHSNFVPNSLDTPPGRENQRVFTIYLPYGYDPNGSITYPVVYFLHGLGGNQNSFPDLPDLLDQAIDEQLIIPLIMVKVDGSSEPIPGDDLPGGTWYVDSYDANGDPLVLYEKYMIEELIPYVDAHYRTKADRGYRAIMGQSMGGYGSLLYGLKYPEFFSGFASDSGTAFWVFFTGLANPDPLYYIKQMVLPEIPTSGPREGELTPGSSLTQSNTNNIFSYANAFSPDSSKGVFPYNVDLPLLVDANFTPITDSSGKIIPNNPILTRWGLYDPYNFITLNKNTLQKQAIYLDGGNTELGDAVGARFFSDSLVNNDLDHEYILYNGGHTTCLTDFFCSRFLTNLELFSVLFAAGGTFADDIRTKMVGTGTLILEDDAKMSINQDALFGIETLPSLAITNTNITLDIYDNAQLTIPGGAFQVGNRFSKARIQGDPSLATNTIFFTLVLDGSGAAINIKEQGFFGFGVGIDGKIPSIPNQWGISGLTNVVSINMQALNGTFTHSQIATGNDNRASLLAFGPANSYSIYWDENNAHLLGGGNIIQTVDTYKVLPLITTTAGTLPPTGIRTDLDFLYPQLDDFYNQPQATPIPRFYTDQLTVGICSSQEMLFDAHKAPLPSIATQADVFNFFKVEEFTTLDTKAVPVTALDGTDIIDDVINSTINRPSQPGAASQAYNGAVGAKIVQQDDQFILLRTYSLNPEP